MELMEEDVKAADLVRRSSFKKLEQIKGSCVLVAMITLAASTLGSLQAVSCCSCVPKCKHTRQTAAPPDCRRHPPAQVLWVGISFQQSASTVYFRKVRCWIQVNAAGRVWEFGAVPASCGRGLHLLLLAHCSRGCSPHCRGPQVPACPQDSHPCRFRACIPAARRRRGGWA